MAIRYYHTFPGRAVGLDDTPRHYERLRQVLPSVLDRTVIDVGAWDGYYSFKMAEEGARRVLATDAFCWSGAGWGTKEAFDLLVPELGRGVVESLEIDPADIHPETVGMFDIVLYLGILYHRPDCLQSFLNAASVCRGHLVVESLIDFTLPEDRPVFAFHPFDSCAGDPTNWFVPNIEGVKAMYRLAGFRDIKWVEERSCGIAGHGRASFCGVRPDAYLL